MDQVFPSGTPKAPQTPEAIQALRVELYLEAWRNGTLPIELILDAAGKNNQVAIDALVVIGRLQ
jgi:hypothetical protein